MYLRSDDDSQLQAPALLLGGRAGGSIARAGATARDAAVDQRPAPRARGGVRRRALPSRRTRARDHGLRPAGSGYAEEIFALGDELHDVVRDETARGPPFRVGIADSVPKSVTYRWWNRRCTSTTRVHLVCREGRLASLLADLAVHRLDVVIADRPLPPDLNVRGYSHRLGASDVTVFATAALAGPCAEAFPALLDNAPFLLPGEASRPGRSSCSGSRRGMCTRASSASSTTARC